MTPTRIDLYTEDRDLCTYPRGYYFEWVRFIQANDEAWIMGKGRLGCLTKVKLTEEQARYWKEKHANGRFR